MSEIKVTAEEFEDDAILAQASMVGGYQMPDTNPKTVFGEMKPKISDVPVIGIREMGKVFANGARKYGRFNWRDHEVSATVYYDAAWRHLSAFYEGEDIDPESGLPHLAHVMACATIIMDAQAHGKLNDNRWTSDGQPASD
jgi:hypothetical protein